VRIGIDVRALGTASGRRGVGAYIRGLLGGLAREAGGDDEFLLFGNGREEDLPRAGCFAQVRLRRPRRAVTLWDQVAWPALLARRRVTVFHSPFYALPRFRPRGCRLVQTVHDLTPLKLPGSVSPRNARIFRINFGFARSADRIIVPSEATRADVLSLLDVPAGKVVVIPLAAGIDPKEVEAARGDVARVASRLGLAQPGRRYLLHTGGHDVVKNLPGLLDAFAILARQGRPIDLVIAGDHGTDTTRIIGRAAMLGVMDRVRLPGYLPRADLIALYGGAAAMVYPSWTEGFGLPLLEAMACGAPVVASRAGAIPEVAGEAALLVEPADTEGIAAAVGRILDDEALAARLAAAGRDRAAGFTWAGTARRTLQVYRETAA
jgi:glycosyltransferase involved in cell wall biosynthesis